MRRRGFSFAEILAALTILAILVPAGISAKAVTDEELAVMEAESLARWLRAKFLEADAANRYFEISTAAVPSAELTVHWLSDMNGNVIKRTAETYSSGGRALFSVPGTALRYSPTLNSLTPFGVTISVRRKTGQGSVPRYVIVSRFGRVRVSETPPRSPE